VCSPLLLRICFNALLYPSVYLPDLTTSARRAAIDSVDLADFDFLVGAIGANEKIELGVGLGGDQGEREGMQCKEDVGKNYTVCGTPHSWLVAYNSHL
jgi:hypothetical protein